MLELRLGFIIIRNNVVARFGKICSRWKSLEGVNLTPEEAEKFRKELVGWIQDDIPIQVGKANTRGVELERKGMDMTARIGLFPLGQ